MMKSTSLRVGESIDIALGGDEVAVFSRGGDADGNFNGDGEVWTADKAKFRLHKCRRGSDNVHEFLASVEFPSGCDKKIALRLEGGNLIIGSADEAIIKICTRRDNVAGQVKVISGSTINRANGRKIAL